MRNSKLSPKFGRLILTSFVMAGLLLLSSCSRKTDQATCHVDWGKALVSKSCTIKSGAEGEPSQFRFKIPKWNLKKENIYIDVSGENMNALEGLAFSGFAAEKKLFTYTLPLYQDKEYNLIQNNIVTSLSLPLAQSTLTHQVDLPVDTIRVYLKVHPGTDLQLRLGKVRLKKKPSKGFVSFTFDDGYDEHHQAAMALYSRGFKGTFYVIPDMFNKDGYLTSQQIKAIHAMDSEISSHHQTPITQFESPSKLKSTLKVVRDKITNETEAKRPAKHFAYPLGKYDKSSLQVIKQVFESARLAGGGVETIPPSSKHRLRVFNVTNSETPEKLIQLIQASVAKGDWIILMFHYFDEPEKGDMSFPFENFEKLLSQIKLQGLPVKTISEALKYSEALDD